MTALTSTPPEITDDVTETRSNRAFMFGAGLVTTVAVSFAALTVAWFVDENDRTALVRNVEVAGTEIGGQEPAAAMATLATYESELTSRPLVLSYEGGELETTLGDLGASIEREAIVRQAAEAGREGVFPMRQFRWLGTFAQTTDVPLRLSVDNDVLASGISELGSELGSEPIEPQIISNEVGSFEMVPGAAGYRVDLEAIAASVAAVEPAERGNLVVELDRTVTEPAVSNEQAQAFADEIGDVMPPTLRVNTDIGSFSIPGGELRSWVEASVVDGELVPTMKAAKAEFDVDRLAAPLNASDVAPHFEVDDNGGVQLMAGNALGCCDEAGINQIFDAALAGETTVALDLVPIGEAGEVYAELASYGIEEEVATFTTNYAPGQGRVTNIRHIAALTQGYVIEPGGYFSVNEYIGKRTREKGFVGAGVIYGGRYTEDVGGGISQYATTMFNAGYFAGLEMEEYQSHSLYISRYPYGREATLSFPAPDLKMRNDTPYGILIWPTTTATSITVQMFSTKYYDVRETHQSKSRATACTVVSSHRERIMVDTGEVINDATEAVYRPGEGLDCNGRETAPLD